MSCILLYCNNLRTLLYGLFKITTATTVDMGGRKFRLSKHRKNEERKRRQKRAQTCSDDSPSRPDSSQPEIYTVSLPMSAYLDRTVSTVATLTSRLLGGHHVPSTWFVARQIPLLLCKLSTHDTTASVEITLSIQHNFFWTVTVGNQVVTPDRCPLLIGVPDKLTSASAVCKLLSTIDDLKHCPGNVEPRLLEQWRQRSLTLHGHSGMLLCVAYTDHLIFIFVFSGEQMAHIDAAVTGIDTLRHHNCQRFLESGSKAVRCASCTSLRGTLRAQTVRQTKETSAAVHVNLR